MLFKQSICTVHPLSCHMVSMSWNDHSLLMQCPGHVQAVSRPCPGRVQQAVHLELFWTCSWRTFPTKHSNMREQKGGQNLKGFNPREQTSLLLASTFWKWIHKTEIYLVGHSEMLFAMSAILLLSGSGKNFDPTHKKKRQDSLETNTPQDPLHQIYIKQLIMEIAHHRCVSTKE